MSTDYAVICDKCRTYRHLGQRFAGSYSFGYGSNDKETMAAIMEWITDHTPHNDLRVCECDSTPLDYRNLEDDESTQQSL